MHASSIQLTYITAYTRIKKKHSIRVLCTKHMDTRLGIRRLVPRRVSICFCTQSTDRVFFNSRTNVCR